MKIIARLLLIAVLFTTNNLISQSISIGKRHSFNSEILNEERSYQVYLPPSYYSNTKVKFPVLYVLDGDYNFHYDSGIIEFLSNSAFTIPEMILIGVSDKGSTKQLANSDPKKVADTFIQFINSELKPLINKSYRTTNLEMLAGHSKFGIFTTHYWMTQPDDFDVFLAIDPSYWFNEYEIVKRLETELQNGFNPKSKLYISQANTQGMRIDEFVAVLEKEAQKKENWQLNQYLDDNHGSLHIKVITDALNTIFKGWDLDRETFYAFKNGTDVINHYKKLNNIYNTEFLLPWYSLSNITYFYVQKEQYENLQLLEEGIKMHFPASLEEYRVQLANNYLNFKKLEDAEQLFSLCLDLNPKSYKALEGLSKINGLKGNETKKTEFLNNAIDLAKSQNARQYYLNELYSQLN